jgi:glycosyltransferase involved in cell wall biosynthesis
MGAVILNAMLAGGFGGLEQVFLEYQTLLSDYAARRGAVCLAAAREDGEAMRRLRASGVAGRPLTPLTDWDPISRRRARRLVRAASPNLVVCHGQRAYRLLAPATPPGAALVACIHKPKFDVDLHRTTYVCVSPHLADLVRAAGVPAERVHVVPNRARSGPAPHDDAPRSRWRERPLILSAGRLHPKKGLDVLIRAAAQLRDSGVEFDLVIAGEGSERPALERLVGALALEERVRLPGWVPDVAAFLAEGDLFAMPSHQEGCPLVLLDAMAAGLPVVASDIDGVRDIVTSERLGVLTPPGDPAALAVAIRRLLRDPGGADALGRAARDAARREHGMDRVEQRLIAVIDPLFTAVR